MEQSEYFFLLFIPAFIGMWCAIAFLIGHLSGWQSLARIYAARAREFTGEKWRMRSGTMRWTTRYNNALTLGADPYGLYLAVMFLFRVAHPPLYIPWHAIEIRERRGLLFTYVEFHFTEVPGVYLSVPAGVGRKVTSRKPHL